MAEIITPPLVTTDPLDISDLTETQMVGAGVLDKMLQTMRVHLSDQFEKERIRGPEYATVYLGAFQATLDAAINFLLAKQKQGLELKLLEGQAALVQAQEDQIRAEMQKIPLEMDQIVAQTNQIIKQTELADKQIELADKQIAQADKQLELMDKQLAQADKQLELTEAQIQVQLKQVELMEEQLVQARAQTEYYEQRTITERAQTQAGVAAPTSVIGTQVTLMNKQADGYDRNAEQQAAQIWANTWNVRRQTDEDTVADSTNRLDDASLGKVMNKMAQGINVIL